MAREARGDIGMARYECEVLVIPWMMAAKRNVAQLKKVRSLLDLNKKQQHVNRCFI